LAAENSVTRTVVGPCGGCRYQDPVSTPVSEPPL
jgi:hypothetical protein